LTPDKNRQQNFTIRPRPIPRNISFDSGRFNHTGVLFTPLNLGKIYPNNDEIQQSNPQSNTTKQNPLIQPLPSNPLQLRIRNQQNLTEETKTEEEKEETKTEEEKEETKTEQVIPFEELVKKINQEIRNHKTFENSTEIYNFINDNFRNQLQNSRYELEDDETLNNLINRITKRSIKENDKLIDHSKESKSEENLIEEKEDNLIVREPSQPITEQLITEKSEKEKDDSIADIYNHVIGSFNSPNSYNLRRRSQKPPMGIYNTNLSKNLANNIYKYEQMTGNKITGNDIPLISPATWINTLIKNEKLKQNLTKKTNPKK
jgi:hypothetical protein